MPQKFNSHGTRHLRVQEKQNQQLDLGATADESV